MVQLWVAWVPVYAASRTLSSTSIWLSSPSLANLQVVRDGCLYAVAGCQNPRVLESIFSGGLDE